MQKISRRTALGASFAAATTLGTAAPAQADPIADLPASELGRTPHTKFAVNIEMWFTGLPFLNRFAAAAELGFPAIEFWPHAGRDIDRIAELAEELHLEIAQFTAWGFEPGLNDPRNHADFLEAIRTGCDVAHRLKCRKMTVVGGNDQPGMTQAEMHEHIIVGLKAAAPLAEDNDVMLILEPMNIRVDHKGHCLYGSEAAVRICREVDSTHVKINWDLYHMQISEGDLCGRLRDGFDQVGYLQLADHPGRFEPGTGEVHYNRVLREAYDLGYRDAVGLECRPRGTEVEAARNVARADLW